MAFFLALTVSPLLAQALQTALQMGIIDLTPTRFDRFVQQTGKVAVYFVDGREDQTREMSQALHMIRDYGSNLPLARIDATKYSDLAERYFHGSGCLDKLQLTSFDGVWSQGNYRFVIENNLANDKWGFFDLGGGRCSLQQARTYLGKLAHNGYSISWDDGTVWNRKQCVKRFPQLLWFNNGQPTQYHRMVKTPQDILSFVVALDRDLIDTVDSEVATKKWDQVVLLRAERNSPLYKAMEVVAGRHLDSVAFAHITSNDTNISWLANGSVQEIFEGELDTATIDAWVRRRLTVSEVPPEAPADESIVVFNETFEHRVLLRNRDVMMVVFAPWCGFCRQAMSQWARFSTLLKDVPGAPIVAKMDGTGSRPQLPDFHWKSYPSVVYFRNGEKRPVLFDNASYTVDDFLEFAKQHSTSSIELASEGVILLQQQVRLRPVLKEL